MSTFAFKQFSIDQEEVSMKVGVDGVLLGAWVQMPDNVATVLDIGTGTGLIALMLAQRYVQAKIQAVELDKKAAEVAQRNVTASPWSDRIEVICADVADYLTEQVQQYDVIVSNPPYYTKGYPVDDTGRKLARDTESLPHAILATLMCRRLHPNGISAVILPVQEGERFIQLMEQAGAYLIRHTRLITKKGKPEKRSLLAFSLTAQPLIEDTLYMYSENGEGFSEAYRALTKDFYLAF